MNVSLMSHEVASPTGNKVIRSQEENDKSPPTMKRLGKNCAPRTVNALVIVMDGYPVVMVMVIVIMMLTVIWESTTSCQE